MAVQNNFFVAAVVVAKLLTAQYIYMFIEDLLLEDSVPTDTSCFNKYGQLSPRPPPSPNYAYYAGYYTRFAMRA